MKITSLQNTYIINPNKYNKTRNAYCKNAPPCDVVSFKGKASLNDSWDDFKLQIRQKYPAKDISQVLLTSVSNSENKLGEGAKKIVYSIDGIDDYVVAYMKEEEFNPAIPCVSCIDNFPEFNIGQSIGKNGAGFAVMKKITGKNHGIPNWNSKYVGTTEGIQTVTKQDAKLFLSQLRTINSMPSKAYLTLAQEIRYLTDKQIKIDMINPNNLMVDEAGQKMTYFDLFERPEVFYPILPEVNSVQDMAYLLVDPLLQSEYLKVLEPDEQKEMIALTKNIIKKAKEAGKSVGLIDDEHIVSTTYALLQGRLTVKNKEKSFKYLEYYNEFRKIYKEVI